jgi:putative transposase
MHIKRTYKYQLRPSYQQQIKLNKIVGSCRYIYNIFLNFNIKQYEKNKKTINVPDMLNMLNILIDREHFLKEIPLSILESTVITLKSEITAHIKGKKSFPPYRKKGWNDYFSVIKNFEIQSDTISIDGIQNIKFYNSRKMDGKVSTVTIRKRADKWEVSLLLNKEIKKEPFKHRNFVGIDVGLKEFATLSTGHSIANPNFYRTLEEKLIKEQSKLSKKKMHSKSWFEQKNKIQKIHDKIYNSRMNFLHKVSSFIIQKYDVIGIEKLNIKDMSKNKQLSKSVLDASWSTFVKLLKYKAQEHSKVVIEVDRYFPSSQLCSNCKSKQAMPLNLRFYECENCNEKIDRDYNAAKNIADETKRLFINRYLK